jgi:hypothetical protein
MALACCLVCCVVLVLASSTGGPSAPFSGVLPRWKADGGGGSDVCGLNKLVLGSLVSGGHGGRRRRVEDARFDPAWSWLGLSPCCFRGDGTGREERPRYSSSRWVRSYTTAAICESSGAGCCLSRRRGDSGRLPVFALPYLLVERRPSIDFLPGRCCQDGRLASCCTKSASPSSAWCWRRRRGGAIVPSGSVPGGGGTGFVHRLKKGLDRVLHFVARVLSAKSMDWTVIFVSLSPELYFTL